MRLARDFITPVLEPEYRSHSPRLNHISLNARFQQTESEHIGVISIGLEFDTANHFSDEVMKVLRDQPMVTREEKIGKAILRWQIDKNGGFTGAVIIGGKRVALITDVEEVRLIARLRNEAGKLHPDYVGFDGAMKRYLHCFPDGFRGTANASSERGYKERAAKRLQEVLPIDQAGNSNDSDASQVANGGIQTNMLSPFEAARLRDTLLGKNGGQFLRGAAAFVRGDYSTGLLQMSAAVQSHGRISWPILTYLPFLWNYKEHMFMKPKVTTDFANRVGHNFSHRYSADPNPETYLALLDLIEVTRGEIESLEPRDNIDLQSFIWVVGEYREQETADS